MDVTDSAAVGRQRVVGLADLVRIPVRRWRIVLAGAVLVTFAVVGYLQVVPADYTATSVVVVRAVVTDPFTYPSGGADRAVNMTAENGVATSNDVIDKTAAMTGRTADEVRKALTVEIPVGGQVLRFNFDGRSAREAVSGANAAADTYLHVRQGLYEDQRAALLKSYDGTIALVTDQRKAAEHGLPVSLNQNTSSPSIQAILDQVRALNDQLAQLAEQRAKIASADLSPGVVTSAARQPVPSSHDAAALFVLAGALSGLLLGAIIAYLRESLDRRVRSVAEAAEVTGLPALGIVRATRRRGGRPADADTRYVALALSQWTGRQPARLVVVLSSRGDERRTQVAAGLAVALAEAGHDVYLGGAADRLAELRRLLAGAQLRTYLADSPVSAPRSPAAAQNQIYVQTPAQAQARARANRALAADPDELPGDAGPTSRTIATLYAATLHAGEAGTLAGTNTGSNNRAGVTVAEKHRNVASGPPAVGAAPGAPGSGGRPPDVRSLDVAGDDDTLAGDLMRIGAGTIRLGLFEQHPQHAIVVLDAPSSETDERGVRAAQSGVAVLVAARDQTRSADLGRLADRVRAAGVQAVGFVLTGDGRV
jgi:capsular polysaccharide biosynthesis protein